MRLMDAIRDIVLVVQADGHIADANEAAVTAYGYSRDELRAMRIADLRVADLEASVADHMHAANLQGILFETVHRRKDGSSFPVEVSSQGIDLPSGRVLLSVVRDISERKRAETALRQSQQLLQKTLASLRDAVFVTKVASAKVVLCNPAVTEVFGYAPEELVGRTTTFLYVDDAALEEFRRQLYAAIAERGYLHLQEYLMRRKDGSVFPTEQMVTPLEGEAGNRVGWVNVVRDITERKRAEADRERFTEQIAGLARLAQQRAREIETAVRSIADAVFICDGKGAVTLANEAALQLIGARSLSEGHTLASYMERLRLRFRDGTPIEGDQLVISRALEGETVRQQAEVGTHPVNGADLDLLVSAAPIRDDEGRIVGAVEVARDVTELMELDRLQEQFISVAAHELKTPVAVMKGFAQLLLRRQQGATADQRRVLERIDQGANRIDGIVQAILDVSAFSSDQVKLNLETLDLTEFVAREVDIAAAANPKHHYALVRADHPAVQADRQRLGQVVHTLLDNASRYSPNGGEIEIAVESVEGRAVVSVRDHGIGIPGTKKDRIFQRFYRAHTGTAYDYGGLGVGLFIARSIVILHGGGMDFESEEGKGSTFWFTLPTIESSASA